RADPEGRPAAAVVDLATPGPAADLSRGAPHVRAGGCRGWQSGDAARAASHGCLPDGRGPGLAADRCPARPRSCPAHHDADLHEPAPGALIRRLLAHPAEQPRQAAARAAAPPAPGYRPETLAVLFGGRS